MAQSCKRVCFGIGSSISNSYTSPNVDGSSKKLVMSLHKLNNSNNINSNNSITKEEEEGAEEEDSFKDENNKPKNTPLHLAVKLKDIKLLKKGVQSCKNIDEPDEDYKTALHLAVQEDFLPAIEVLVKNGANIVAKDADPEKISKNLYNSQWTTPLHMAVSANRLDMINLLLTNKINKEAFQDKTARKIEALVPKSIIRRKSYKVKKSNPNTYDTSINLTSKNYSIQQLKDLGYNKKNRAKLFGKHPDIDTLDSRGRTPLWIAVQNKSYTIIDCLLESGANTDTLTSDNPFLIKQTVLHAAVKAQDTRTIGLLLANNRSKVNTQSENGETVLTFAAMEDNLDIVKMLIKKSAKFHDDKNGYAPYHVAVENNAIKVTKYFLDSLHEDVNLTTGQGENALQIAVRRGSIAMVNLLLDRGININHFTVNNNKLWPTPLYSAMMVNNSEIVNLLIMRGADVNTVSSLGETMLRKALIRNDFKMVKRLLDYGADININNVLNQTQSSLARDLILWHSMKLKAAELRLCYRCFDQFANDKIFLSKCEEEVTRMKKEKIDNSNVYYYDLLVKNVYQLAMFARNIDIVEELELRRLKRKYPLYAEIMICHFRKGQLRNRLIDNVEVVLNSIFIQLPYDCVMQILKYLSNQDMVKCFKS